MRHQEWPTTYVLKQERGVEMVHYFRLEPCLGSLQLIARRPRYRDLVTTFLMEATFTMWSRAMTSPLTIPHLSLQLHFDPDLPPHERVYWAEDSNTLKEVISCLQSHL